MIRILCQSPSLVTTPYILSIIHEEFFFGRYFSTKPHASENSSPFLSIPENKLHFEINRYKSVGGNAAPNDINSRVVVSFKVDEADWMPEDVKKVFVQQQAAHINSDGVFSLISTLHRSIVANHVEIMRKLQKKVNQACISSVNRHTIGIIDPSLNEHRLKEKRKRGELSRKRRRLDKDYDLEDFF
ncbi:hypothetical protein JH06_1352 [Blastocystis sp. subtype 4]|uniref:hypothetical protein n=1 Tax=Blastocystis sp. subtype 4 TaxID=944170 RepID=UPI000711CBDF|nr:hypothetical protein JH06_1352 [Blastocystis sp. subtype 4]KNB46783.1 hypothetical protein JH06_1352 [Blastocystis sp. subtype 4]|eukprot:XP_014530208.1 hypothetical protein JH06_1352 [Blastocystis sp. subtype 4]